MKRRGYLRQKIGGLRQHISNLEPFTLYDPCEQPVIRAHVKFLGLCDKQHRTSRCADSRINYRHEDGTRRKIAHRGIEQICCGAHIKDTHLVGEVNELSRGMDAQNSALELGHIGIACAKIGEQRNNHDTPHVLLQSWPTGRAPRRRCRNSVPLRAGVTPLGLQETVSAYTRRAVTNTLPHLLPQDHQFPTRVPRPPAVRMEYDRHHWPRRPGQSADNAQSKRGTLAYQAT